jgi:sulfur carrier protein
MKLMINGEARECDAATVAELWRAETADLDLPGPQGYAIAHNGAVVRQAAWAATRLADGDRIEIIHAKQGG